MPARNERLDRGRRRPRKRVHLRDLDDLNASDLQGRVLAGDVAQTIREPIIVHQPRSARLRISVCPAALRARAHGRPCSRADRYAQPTRSSNVARSRGRMGYLRRGSRSIEPCVQAGHAVPTQRVEVIAHRMERVMSGRRLYRSPNVTRRRVNALALKPDPASDSWWSVQGESGGSSPQGGRRLITTRALNSS